MDPARRQFEFMQKKINDAEADADRRLELLKRYNKEKKVCMFCHTRWHTDDCELAKELKEYA